MNLKEQSPRQARKERRLARRVSADTQNNGSPTRLLTRRNLLITALGIGAAVATYEVFGPPQILTTPPAPATNPDTNPFLPEGESQTISYQRIVEKETIRLGLYPEPSEAALWNSYDFTPIKKEPPFSEADIQESITRLHRVRELMGKSKNPYLQHATAYLDTLGTPNESGFEKLSLEIYTKPRRDGEAIGTALTPLDNKMHITMAFYIGNVLQIKEIQLALDIVHEVKHIENIFAFQNSLPPSSTMEERRAKERERGETVIEQVTEEAEGYGIGVQAYIYEYGLGFRSTGSDVEKYAAKFITCGGTLSNSCWKEFVGRDILKIPEPTPVN